MNRKLTSKNRSSAVKVPVSLSFSDSLISTELTNSPTKNRPDRMVAVDEDQSRFAFKAVPLSRVVKMIGR